MLAFAVFVLLPAAVVIRRFTLLLAGLLLAVFAELDAVRVLLLHCCTHRACMAQTQRPTASRSAAEKVLPPRGDPSMMYLQRKSGLRFVFLRAPHACLLLNKKRLRALCWGGWGACEAGVAAQNFEREELDDAYTLPRQVRGFNNKTFGACHGC